MVMEDYMAVLPVLPKLVSGCISLVTVNLTGKIIEHKRTSPAPAQR